MTKKAIIPALLLAVLVFAACSRNIGGGSGMGTGGSAGTAETGDKSATVETAGDENEGQATDEYGFSVFPEGDYIKDKKFDTDDPLPDYDAPLSFAQLGNSFGHTMCESENGWYSELDGSRDNYIMYTDKKTGAVMPLCGKPECTHDSSSCNANIGGDALRLQMYDGALYCVMSGSVLRMEPDGTKRETVCTVDWKIINLYTNDPFVQIHRGYLYYFGSTYDVENGEKVWTASVTACALDGSETFRVFEKKYSDEDSATPRVNVRFIGNDMYIMVTHQKYNEGFYYADLFKWDVKTRQVEALYTEPFPDGTVPFNFDCMPVSGDGIYFGAWNNSIPPSSEEYVPDFSVMKYSFETKSIVSVMKLEGDVDIQFTKNSIVIDGENSMQYVYSFDGKELFQKKHELPCGNYVGGTDEYIYHWNFSAKESEFYIATPLDGGDEIIIGYAE